MWVGLVAFLLLPRGICSSTELETVSTYNGLTLQSNNSAIIFGADMDVKLYREAHRTLNVEANVVLEGALKIGT